MPEIDENEAKSVLEAATEEPIVAAEPELNPGVKANEGQTQPLTNMGVVGHIKGVISHTAMQLGADFEHVRDMIFKHL